jgi:hypothetical protein
LPKAEVSAYDAEMENELRNYLLTCASRFAEKRGFKDATVGNLAAGDWRFFERLREGKSFTARKYDEVMSWFSNNWPDEDWPAAIPRPVTVQSAA